VLLAQYKGDKHVGKSAGLGIIIRRIQQQDRSVRDLGHLTRCPHPRKGSTAYEAKGCATSSRYRSSGMSLTSATVTPMTGLASRGGNVRRIFIGLGGVRGHLETD
jgi:hypothetical protein